MDPIFKHEKSLKQLLTKFSTEAEPKQISGYFNNLYTVQCYYKHHFWNMFSNRSRSDTMNQASMKRWADEEYLNWQKACQLLSLLQPIVAEHVREKSLELHKKIRHDVGGERFCQEFEPKPAKYGNGYMAHESAFNCDCQAWVNRITTLHEHPKNIYYANCEVIESSISPLDLAKIFMGRFPAKYRSKFNDFNKVDVSFLLQCVSNCKFFHVDPALKYKMRDVLSQRNMLMHNTFLSIDTGELEECKQAVDAAMDTLSIDHSQEFNKETRKIMDFNFEEELTEAVRKEACVFANILEFADLKNPDMKKDGKMYFHKMHTILETDVNLRRQVQDVLPDDRNLEYFGFRGVGPMQRIGRAIDGIIFGN